MRPCARLAFRDPALRARVYGRGFRWLLRSAQGPGVLLPSRVQIRELENSAGTQLGGLAEKVGRKYHEGTLGGEADGLRSFEMSEY